MVFIAKRAHLAPAKNVPGLPWTVPRLIVHRRVPHTVLCVYVQERTVKFGISVAELVTHAMTVLPTPWESPSGDNTMAGHLAETTVDGTVCQHPIGEEAMQVTNH